MEEEEWIVLKRSLHPASAPNRQYFRARPRVRWWVYISLSSPLTHVLKVTTTSRPPMLLA